MYEEYFGLERPPFKITPDTSLFFDGGKRGDILAALVYAIHRGEGIVKVVGEVGSGKTMLCRMLQLKLPETVEIVYIANPSVSPEDILFVIAHELSLPVTREASKHEVMHQLHDYLLRRHMENRQVVLFVEEAQGMPLETLEEIRLLSNLETDQHKLLQIVLFGQPELDDNLAKQSIRQLRERITHNFALMPLDQEEIHSYLNFRMREVGYTGPELISKSIAKKVEQHSGGLLRRINIIADKILLSAYAEGTHNLSTKHVTRAVDDSEFSYRTRGKTKALWWLVLLVLLALAFGLYRTQGYWIGAIAPETAPKQQNTAINDKKITDIAPRPEETGESDGRNDAVIESKPSNANALAGSGVGDEPGDQPGSGKASPVTTVDNKAGSSEQVEQVVQQVEKVVNEIEAAVSRAEAAVQQAPALAGKPEPVAVVDTALPLVEPTIERSTGNPAPAAPDGREPLTAGDYRQWLEAKLKASRDWLIQADRNKVSIQVLMRSKSGARELVYYLRNEWPLDLSKTYLYEVNIEDRAVYRVFYSEFDSLAAGRSELKTLPESVKSNSPYLNSVYRMQKALL